jgi:hypothetical protein
MMKKYTADSLFQVETVESGKINKTQLDFKFPFNLNFKIKIKKTEEFKGPGIYCTSYKNEVIYIGSYNSFKPAIIHDRWKKHIMTFTNRGYRLGFNSVNNQYLIPETLRQYFDQEREWRYCDTGTVTSPNRLLFVLDNFEEFKYSDDNSLIQDFSFYYCQMSQTKDCILQIEQELIKGLNPRCNNGFDRNKITSETLTVARVEEELEKLIMGNK